MKVKIFFTQFARFQNREIEMFSNNQLVCLSVDHMEKEKFQTNNLGKLRQTLEKFKKKIKRTNLTYVNQGQFSRVADEKRTGWGLGGWGWGLGVGVVGMWIGRGG